MQLLALIVIAALAPVSDAIWGQDLAAPLLVGAFVPLAQATEAIAGCALILREQLHVRAWFYTVGMGARLAGVAIGATRGVTGASAAITISASSPPTTLNVTASSNSRRSRPQSSPVT